MAHKYIQPQIFSTNLPKSQAISAVERYINSENHISEFKNGEIVSIEYKIDNVKYSTTAIVFITGNTAKIFAQISENDTIKIIEKDGTEAPEDRNSLWLSDNWDSEVEENYDASDLKSTVKRMLLELKTLRNELALCKEALTNTLGGGDILLDSEKYELENEYEPEKPEDAQTPYTTGDTNIYDWDVYIGDSKLSEYSDGGLYKGQRYHPRVRAFNSAGEEIEMNSAITCTMFCAGGTAEVSLTGNTLYALTSGDTTLYATINDETHAFTDSKSYLLIFERNEKPSYQEYNVKHLLVKDAKNVEYMMENFNYLLVGEFCWCIKEQALYLKEKAANGTIQLFKINGGGSVTPTGKTETITYNVSENGTLLADCTESAITISEDGVLTLVGIVDENGVLILNSTEITSGSTSGDTSGSTSGETEIISYNIDRNGVLDLSGAGAEDAISRNGVLTLIGEIDRNGILTLNGQ